MAKYRNTPCYLDLDSQTITPVSEAPIDPSSLFSLLRFDSKIVTDVLLKPTQEIWVNQTCICTYTPDFQVFFEDAETGSRLRTLTFEAKKK